MSALGEGEFAIKSEFGMSSEETGMQTSENDSVFILDYAAQTPFSTKTWREDITLVVQGKRLYVASNILSLLSPVFTQMFEDVLKNDRSNEIELKDKRFEDVVEFLQCLYPNIQKSIGSGNVFAVLPLAAEYNMPLLIERCRAFFMSQISSETSVEDLCSYLKDACAYDLADVREACIELLAKTESVNLETAEKKCPLPLDAKVEIQGRVISHYEEMINTIDIKRLWLGKSQDIKGFSNACVCALKYSTQIPDGQLVESPAISIHRIYWSILVDGRRGEVGCYLKAKPRFKSYTCRVHAVLLVRECNKTDLLFSRTFDHEFDTGQNTIGFGSFKERLKKGDHGCQRLDFEIRFIVNEPWTQCSD